MTSPRQTPDTLEHLYVRPSMTNKLLTQTLRKGETKSDFTDQFLSLKNLEKCCVHKPIMARLIP